MDLHRYSDALVLAAFLVAASAASAEKLSQPAPLSNSQWEDIRQQVVLLDKIAYLPSLLPVVMTNRDALELSDAQVAAFRQWRKLHYREMVDLMNEIIQRRITLSKTTLDDRVSQDDMLAQQKEIFSLQEDLLRLRLSCRELIVSTFSPIQWDNLAFILEEYPRYAGLLDD